MAKKFITNEQKELIFAVLPNLSIEKIEKIIKLLLEEKYDEVKKELKGEKKELVDKILSISKNNLESKGYAEEKETDTSHFTKTGHKRVEALEQKIEDSHPITQDNFYKHPAHFKYVAYLLNELEQKYHDSNVRLKLRKAFLGQEDASATMSHQVEMFREYVGKDKDLEKYLKDKPHMLRNDFSDEELIRISNSLVATLRDYYYRDFLGLKNYQDYVINETDSKEEKKKKTRKIRFLDAAVASRQGEFGMSNEDMFERLKRLREQKVPYGQKTMLDQIDEHIFAPILEHHKTEVKEKILNTFLTNKNFLQYQHFLNDYLKANPDIPQTQKETLMHAYQEKNLNEAKHVFGQIMPKGMGNYPVAERKQFDAMRKMYSAHNKKADKYHKYMMDPDEKHSKRYSQKE